MKIEYIRNMQFGYMQIESDKPLNKIEEEMLSHNRIEGILPIRWQKENDRYLLRYDITGKQALDAILEQETMDEEILRNLLSGIFMVIKQMEKYLLSQNGILLQPETIFIDMKTGQIYFCYYPNEEERLQKRFRQLMEYILAKTNHKNPIAVELAYGVYEESLKEEFVLTDIKEKLEKKAEEVYETQEILEEKSIEETQNIVIEESLNDKRKWKVFLEVWKAKYVTWINKKLKKTKKQTAQIVFEPEEEEQKTGLHTIFLGEWKEEIEGILKYEGTHFLPDFSIKKTPFFIGNDGECDGVIQLQTISRQHAKIYKIDDVYFIEDLNSTNGTTVEGEILNYKTKVSLKKNVIICFANEPYRFL